MKFSKILILSISSVIFFLSVIFLISCDNRIIELPDYRIVSITADPDTIYADNNITYSVIEVLVKDDKNFVVVNENVTFRTDLGNIIYQVATDSTGIASTTFWDSGVIGLATIEAFVSDISASIQVVIEETPQIESLTLSLNSNELNIDETTIIRASAQNALGNVPDGTLIVFETTRGFFRDEGGIELGTLTQIQTTNGVAKVYFNAGTQKGVATITALISDLVVSENITIHPGSPTFLYLTPEVTEVQVGSNEDVLIIAQVEDKYHNAMDSGVGVEFSTSLGSIIEYDNTDSLGIAETIFSPGITAGSALIEAVADSATASTVITVVSDEVYSIEFAFSQQVDIQVQGTGGQESFEFQVNLYDMNGNLIDYSTTVWFKFINGPDGTNINNLIILPFPDPDSLSVESTNGHAIVSVSSGEVSGTVALKAYTYNTSGQEIFSIKTNIVVHAGPPNSVDISIGGHDTGVEMGAGIWQIECAALLNDEYGNPVDYGTAVWFSLPDDPDWATIEAAAYVGNENANGDSLEGIAYTLLNYEGSHTNDSLVIQVEVSGNEPGQVFINQEIVYLPIQYLTIDIVAVPEHIDWDTYNNPPDWRDHTVELSPKVYVTVKDGQNNPIHGQTVVFSSSLGIPVMESQLNMQPTHPNFEPDFFSITDLDGEILKYYRFYKYECPPPTIAGPGQTTATITAQILGTQTSNQVTVILIRYVD